MVLVPFATISLWLNIFRSICFKEAIVNIDLKSLTLLFIWGWVIVLPGQTFIIFNFKWWAWLPSYCYFAPVLVSFLIPLTFALTNFTKRRHVFAAGVIDWWTSFQLFMDSTVKRFSVQNAGRVTRLAKCCDGVFSVVRSNLDQGSVWFFQKAFDGAKDFCKSWTGTATKLKGESFKTRCFRYNSPQSYKALYDCNLQRYSHTDYNFAHICNSRVIIYNCKMFVRLYNIRLGKI